MTANKKRGFGANFRHFFLRGLAILLPSILTIGILIWAYNFVSTRIAEPINVGIRNLIVQFDWPTVTDEDIQRRYETLMDARGRDTIYGQQYKQWETTDFNRGWLAHNTQRYLVDDWWRQHAPYMDLIGLFVAVVIIYMAGAFLGSFIGKRLVARGEDILRKLPLIRQVYPAVKQVTDFLVGGNDSTEKSQFSKVVAVEYPRKGLWSVGLLTGNTMQAIQDAVGEPCLTVFIPSSPTPFTGYVITIPKKDTRELAISIEEALQFTISGGVVVPPSQIIPEPHTPLRKFPPQVTPEVTPKNTPESDITTT